MFIDIVIQNNINHDRGQRTTNLLLFKDAVNIKKVCILNYSKKKHSKQKQLTIIFYNWLILYQLFIGL